MQHNRDLWILAVCLSAPALIAGGPEHADDFVVGRSAVGQLKIESGAFSEHFVLPPVSGLLNGFSLDEPGFMSLGSNEPDEDFFTLAAGANVTMEIVSISPALKAYTPGFIDTLDMAGETWSIGTPPFDEHPTWHIDSDDAAYMASQLKWAVTFRVVDGGTTGYSASEDYTVVFTNVDSTIPASSSIGFAVLFCGLVVGGARIFRPSRSVPC
jgi:hypothetical protein